MRNNLISNQDSYSKQIIRLNLFAVILIASLIISFSGCSSQKQIAHQSKIVVFGTVVDITLYHTENETELAAQAIQQVEQQFHQFHQQWHAWEKGGIISKINQAIATQSPIEINQSVKNFILNSQTLTQQSQGLFDPGIGKLVALWGFHTEKWQGPPPENKQIQNWLAQQPSLLDIYFEGLTLYSKNPHVQLDFGGNAKGLAIDIALNTIKAAGIESAIVSIGGDMKALGSKNGQPWNIGIQNPKDSNQVLASIQIQNNESIVTSGTYQRYFEWQGQRYSHILNPKTGYPADSFASVTVMHPDATTADSAATALLVAGPKDWEKIAKSMGIHYVFCIDQQGRFFQTEAMARRIKLL